MATMWSSEFFFVLASWETCKLRSVSPHLSLLDAFLCHGVLRLSLQKLMRSESYRLLHFLYMIDCNGV